MKGFLIKTFSEELAALCPLESYKLSETDSSVVFIGERSGFHFTFVEDEWMIEAFDPYKDEVIATFPTTELAENASDDERYAFCEQISEDIVVLDSQWTGAISS